jgi:hypothetical protein
MDRLLQSDFIAYLKRLDLRINYVGIDEIRSEVINDIDFDIKDKESTIKQPLGAGSVTYKNPNKKIIAVIDYEDFLNKQPQQPAYSSSEDVIKALKLKKLDFIVYDLGTNTFFILNELSQSENQKNKQSDALLQLHNALLYFYRVDTIKAFIDSFADRRCVFSNRYFPMDSPDSMADAFEEINKLLSSPIKPKFQPITKLGFDLVETNIINV